MATACGQRGRRGCPSLVGARRSGGDRRASRSCDVDPHRAGCPVARQAACLERGERRVEAVGVDVEDAAQTSVEFHGAASGQPVEALETPSSVGEEPLPIAPVTSSRTAPPGRTRRAASNGVVTVVAPTPGAGGGLDADELGRLVDADCWTHAGCPMAVRWSSMTARSARWELATDRVGRRRLEERLRVLAGLDRLEGSVGAGYLRDLGQVVARQRPAPGFEGHRVHHGHAQRTGFGRGAGIGAINGCSGHARVLGGSAHGPALCRGVA